MKKCMRFDELSCKSQLTSDEWNELDALAMWIIQHEAEYREFRKIHASPGKST